MTQTVDGYSVVAFLPFVVLAPALALPLSRRFGHSWWLLVFSIASVGAIVSVTVTGRMLKLTSWGRGDIVFSWLYDANSWSQALSLDRTWILNALLFAPAGCFCTLAFRRPWITLVSLSVFAFVIEMVQRSTRLGVADVSDLVANVAGAATGTMIGLMLTRRLRTPRGPLDSNSGLISEAPPV